MGISETEQAELKRDYPLAPCPFCGRADSVEYATVCECELCSTPGEDCPECTPDCETDCNVHLAVCSAIKGGCGASSGWAKDVEKVAAKWNRRPGHA